jgi:nucleoside-diphosphate-sugar epimerase
MALLKPFTIDDQILRGQRVLVTGATGFVGGRLAERLIHEHGVEVVTIVRNWTKAVWISRYPVDLVHGDIQDAEVVNAAVKGCTVVFHCASGGGSDQEYLDINIAGTQNIVNACQEHGVRRLIFISTIAVHGPEPPDGANEYDEYRSFGRGYSDSKIAAEKMVLKAGRDGEVQVSIIRPTFVWGPRSNLFTVRPLREMQAGTFRLVNEGQGDCHAVFIETLIDAIIAAGILEGAVGRPFLVTDGYAITWKEFFAPYAAILSKQSLPSLDATSSSVRWRCEAYQRLQSRLEAWKANPAPLWRKVLRKSARVAADRIRDMGVMNEWDLKKFARKGRLNTESTREILGVLPRYTFAEAMELTELWIRDQLGEELQLETAQEFQERICAL